MKFHVLSLVTSLAAVLASSSALASVHVKCTELLRDHRLPKVSVNYNENADGKGAALTFFRESVKGEKLSIETKSVEDLMVQPTVVGSIVSVRVGEKSTPDKTNYFVSLTLPRINLNQNLKKVSFKTVASETASSTTMAGENGVEGVVQNSKYYLVTCTAKLAE